MYNDTGQGSMLHLFLTYLRCRLYCNRNGVLSSVYLVNTFHFKSLCNDWLTISWSKQYMGVLTIDKEQHMDRPKQYIGVLTIDK